VLNFLAIENIVLIDKAEIDFAKGLCILTGETGSGKSILLDALGLAIGFRTNPRLIGQYSDKAQITAEFDISNNQICQKLLAENELLDSANAGLLRIRRIIQENSNHKIYLNDIAIGVNLLGKIGEALVEIHGQDEQRGLLNPAFHLAILDEYAGNYDLLKEVAGACKKLKEIDDKITEINAKKELALKEKDYLEYIIKELENCNIFENEEEDLIKKKDSLIAKEKILQLIEGLKSSLLEANSFLIQGQRLLIKNQNIIDNYLSQNQEKFEEINQEIDHQNNQLDQKIDYLKNLQQEIAAITDDKDKIEERLFLIRNLARKFNVSSKDLYLVLEDAKQKLKLIEAEEINAKELLLLKNDLLKDYHLLAKKLSQKRKDAAVDLAKKVEKELSFLKMEKVKFKVLFNDFDSSDLPDQSYHQLGYDRVKFITAINSDKFDDLSKIASGGELSRFMLALKVALINLKSVPVMVFDEIDAGIGGATADSIGKRLQTLSKKLQILVVTHHPQIAAKSDLHFKIIKTSEGKKSQTLIKKLDLKDKISEIARMLSGQKITKEALEAAKILIEV
jgi:DNA repair protein RecN (Recombination protein N)